MRIYFIKDFIYDGRVFKAGTNAIFWDATEALKGYAVTWEERYAYESHTAEKAAPQSDGEEKGTSAKAAKKNKSKTN